MLLESCPAQYLSGESLEMVSKSVFGVAHGVEVVGTPLPLMQRAAMSSSFAVLKVTLRHGSTTEDVVLKVCGNDLDEEGRHLFGASDDMAAWNCWDREPLAYGDPEVLEALSVTGNFRFAKTHGITPKYKIRVGDREFSTQGVWLEYLPPDQLELSSQLYEVTAKLLGIRDANLVDRTFFPNSAGRRPSAVYRNWFAAGSKADFHRHRETRGGYESARWRNFPDVSDDTRRLLNDAADMWDQREKLFRVASEESMLILGLGDFHRANFTALRDGRSVQLVGYDLQTLSKYPIGEDLMSLTYSAKRGQRGWNADIDPERPREVIEHLYGLYAGALSSQLQSLQLGPAVPTVLRQARRTLVVSWAMCASLAGDLFDPKYMNHFSGGKPQSMMPGMLRGIGLAVSFKDEAFREIGLGQRVLGGPDALETNCIA